MTSPAPVGNPLAASGGPGNPEAPKKIVRRRPATSNPLVSRSQQPRPRPPGSKSVGATSTIPHGERPVPRPINTPLVARAPAPIKVEQVDDSDWQTFKLTTTKASLIKGLRHHVMKLSSKRDVNPLDPEEFTRPIRLHRRDPAAPLQGAGHAINTGNAQNEDPAAAEEKAKQEAERAKKEAERATIQSKIAPYGGAAKPRTNNFKKKTQQVFHGNEEERRLKFEEHYPWHIEDFDNKNTWQGQYEKSMSNGTHAMFVLDGPVFRMIPIDRWYKFTEKNKFKVMDIEAAEKALKASAKVPRWVMKLTKQEEKEKAKLEREANLANMSKLKSVRGDRLAHLAKSETADADELDFEDDQFADDEEAPMVEGDEQENKEIEKRMKKEHLSANLFGLRDEHEVDEEEKERRRQEKLKRKQKKVKKYLINHERNHNYESDSDDDPYAETTDEEDSDQEAIRKEEERKKQEEEAKKDQGQKPKDSQDTAKKPGPSTSIDMKPKPSPKKGKEGSLKRTGSPDLSESGTEKARKKPKKNPAAPTMTGGTPVSATSNNGQPHQQPSTLVRLKIPGFRLQQIMLTPPTVNKPMKKRKGTGPDGPGSGEDTAGEMSDGSGNPKKQRIKMVAGARALSPNGNGTGSRHGTPVPGQKPTSRAASPSSTEPPQFVTDEEIKQMCRSGEIKIHDIGKILGARRIGRKEVKEKLLDSLRRMTVTDRVTKSISLKEEYK
ncbi:hypothetical protein EX30DRAFT_392861 [Ascodesmis nigricans]|uniref:Uncharacterized protein n=1 Tax=Ascodesmis nigricans TaxID=341454 RepID=A0A4S2N864_9PEZI|nr:hypothetical protein EX30DRAFT_392861 [Ascodesmis nigricans]